MSKPGASIEASERAVPEVRLAGKLGGMSLSKQVAVLAVWPLLENVLAFCVGFSDLLISGRIAEGPASVPILDAMGLGGYVAWFFNILQGAVATGVMALVSRATGGRDPDLARRGLGQGLWLGLAAGFLSLLALHFGIPALIKGVGLTPEAAVHAEAFLRVLAWSGPVSGAMFAINAALRGAGDTRTPFIAMLVVNAVNIAVSWFLAIEQGRGVAGIAWGTVTGWVAGLLVVSMVLMRRNGLLSWSLAGLRPHWETLARILRVGAPQSLEIGFMWAIHAYGISIIANLPGEANLGAHILAIRVESMSFLPGWAIGTAGAALAGQYLGAGSKEMAVRAVRLCWKIAVVLMGSIGVIFIFGRDGLIALMAPKSDLHQHLASPLVLICAAAQPFFATCIILKTSMRGAGATTTVMRWSFGSMIFYRIGMMWLLHRQPWFDLRAVWVIFSLDLVTQALVFSWVHFRGKWLDARV
ncbi:MATE family efflux transporter [Luteolibacter flavescens]|uniref:Multidrug-efflux transporter n=1 Tax=Luteolibacter flavescens TaxID=1859460 RepID=A0ABT3FX69_9BACT|nr:MATE family efflux transporter [Luteolibacter flavescens]MCW1887841.1 MATE family efflux transporter [Luteolibacter flavescens]